jgi:hypothetical protein
VIRGGEKFLENEQAVDIDGPFMALALDKKLDLLLPDQAVKAGCPGCLMRPGICSGTRMSQKRDRMLWTII